MRVLQVGPLYVNHLQRWAERARAAGCSVDVAGHHREGRRARDFGEVADRVELAPDGLPERDIATQAEWLRATSERLAPDIVQAHWLPRWGYLATQACAQPVIVTGWGSDVYLSAGDERRRGDVALRDADRVIARSRHMLEVMIARGAHPERTALVDLGVDLERFRPAQDAREARAGLDIGTGPVILSFRAGTPLYNLDVVVEAFLSLRARVPDAQLLVAHGDALVSAKTRAALDAAGAGVRLIGILDHEDMPRYLRAATVGVSIPSSDGSPSSVWEALACGLPVVASDLPQVAERVGASGAVRLVAPESGALAAALLELVRDRRRHAEMAAAARAWAIANVDARDQVELLRRLYSAVGASSR